VTEQRAGRAAGDHREAEPADDHAGRACGAIGCDETDRGDGGGRPVPGVGEAADETGGQEQAVVVGEKADRHGDGEDDLRCHQGRPARPAQGHDRQRRPADDDPDGERRDQRACGGQRDLQILGDRRQDTRNQEFRAPHREQAECEQVYREWQPPAGGCHSS
jgi:hypothetical protein